MKMSFSRENLHKNPILAGFGIFAVLIIALLFTTCDIGLGQIVNTEKPVINTGGDNPPGTYLQGSNNKISLDVSNKQGFKIEKVWMDVDYIDEETGMPATKRIYAQQDPNTGEWYVIIDTTGMADGRITGTVTAIDESGNKTTTTPMVYNVKNSPPQIKLNMPLVEDNNWDDDVFLDTLKDRDPLLLGFKLLGLATDDSGIWEGYPKIMIWPASGLDSTGAKIPVDGDEVPLPPSEGGDPRYGVERSLIVPNTRHGLQATKFEWPMQKLVADPDAPGGYGLPKDNNSRNYLSTGVYRIRIITKDLFGNINEYPNRTDTKRTSDKPSKKYIEINYIASEIPIAQVTTIPQFYNAASDFNVSFIVSCTKPLATVDPVEAYITDGNDNENILGGPYPAIQLPSDGSPYGFTLTIPAAQAKEWENPKEGTLYLKLSAKAKDDINYGPPIYQFFQYDITPPKVPIDRPVPLSNIVSEGPLNGGYYTIYYPDTDTPKWVTETVTVGGINTDDNGIKDVFYHIGKLGDDSYTDPGIYWSEHWNDDNIWEDAKLNTTKPDKGWGGSLIGWNYTASYPIGYKTTGSNSDLVQEFSELKGYSTTNNSETADLERFYLPFYVKVVDNAGNFHIVHYKLCVDPLLDEPQVTITSPDEGAQVGGTVLLSGYATDNYWMHTVLIRVKKENGIYPTGTNTDGAYYLPPDTSPFYPSNMSFPKPKPDGVNEETRGWFKAAKTGDNTVFNWSASINGDKRLDPPDDSLENVKIEVVAIDTNEISHQTPHITGPIETRNLKFSSKVPNIENAKIIKTNVDPVNLLPAGTKTSGKFDISIDISAVGNLTSHDGFYNISARINNASSVIDIIKDGVIKSGGSAWNITSPEQISDRVNSKLTFTVDSTNGGLIPSIPYGSTGSMTLELTVEDTTKPNSFKTTATWTIGIDNFYPTATILTSRIASGNFLVEGTAQDYATGSGDIQGLERVLVYVEKAKISGANTSGRSVYGSGEYLRPNGGSANPSDFITYPNVIDRSENYTGNNPNFASFSTFPKLEQKNDTKVWTSPVAMVIDNAENAPNEDYDGDGTYGEMWNGLLDKSWGARLDTQGIHPGNTGFSDGPYIVHYIIMDQAGNATHYAKDIFIENNKPIIKSINIGTDIDFNGTVDNWGSQISPGEFMQNAHTINLNSANYDGTHTVSSTEFKIRNNLFGIRLELDGGNVTKNAVVTYVDNSTTVDATEIQRGSVYQIATNDQTTDFTKYGAPNNYIGTVFIASGTGEGKGTVKLFTTVGSFREDNYTNLGIGAVTKTIIYSRFTVPGGSSIPDGNDKQFIIKVYDSALSMSSHGTDNEYEQLASVFLLKVAVDNIDETPPTINVTDFGQKWITEVGLNATDDSKKTLTALTDAVYSDYVETNADGDKLGYVQYQAHSTPTTTANISGKVIFNGKAADNHRINKITVQILGYNSNSELTIATRNNTSGLLEPDNYIGGESEFRIVYPLVKQYSLEYGHALTWQYMWDSSKVNNSVASGINITFRVYDGNSTTATAVTSIKNVNIVPYITEIKTPLSGAYSSNPSAFNRSALGGYPVREGDTIILSGFNLGTFTTDTANVNTVTIGTQNLTYAANGTYNGVVYARSSTQLGVTIPTATVSGPLVVKVNGIESFNNRSNRTKTGINYNSPYVAEYNREPNNVNNNILDNSRYMYVWSTGYILHPTSGTTVTPATTRNPFMRMDSNANRYVVFGWYDSGNTRSELHVAKNNGNTNVEQEVNRYINNTIAFDAAGDWYAASSNITSGGTYYFNFYERVTVGGSGNRNSSAQNNKRRLSTVGSNSDRFKVPRIAVMHTNNTSKGTDANADRIYMSYYDSNSNELVFHFGTVGADNSFGRDIATDSTPTKQIVANSSQTNKGSIYSAVGYLSTGRPVIAWYDDTNSCLVFSYGSGDPSGTNVTSGSNIVTTGTTGTNSWQANARRVTSVGSGQGQHVDMVVDSDNVHLAYYDVNNGGLYYAYIPSANVVSNSAAISTYKVDTYLSAGTKLMLNVRNGVPYITYYHGAFTDTKNSIRVAWRKGTLAAGTDGSDRFTGAWEVMTVPVGTVPLSGEFICNGVPTANGNWTSGNLPTGTTLTLYPTLEKSILLGYFTTSHYEGAVLKDDMTTTPSALQK